MDLKSLLRFTPVSLLLGTFIVVGLFIWGLVAGKGGDVLLSVVSGFVGSLLTIAATSFMADREGQRTARAAARLVCLELANDYYFVEHIADYVSRGLMSVPSVAMEHDAWDQFQAPLALALSSDELDVTAEAYSRSTSLLQQIVALPKDKQRPYAEQGETVRYVSDTLDLIVRAVTQLAGKGWRNAADVPSVVPQLQKHHNATHAATRD